MSEDAPFPVAHARFLTRNQAAAYLGVSARTFDLEVRSGIWPPAMRRGGKGGALTWDRRLLDRAADRLAGLAAVDTHDAAMAAAEAAALEAVSRGTPQKHRAQHRHQATA